MIFNKNKFGQFFILSGFFIMLSLLFIYSLETENYYIENLGESSLLSNIIYETCMVGKYSNGSYLDSRFFDFETRVESYCIESEINCNLSIIKQGGAPSNLSLLDYSYYNYYINYTNKNFEYNSEFNCN